MVDFNKILGRPYDSSIDDIIVTTPKGTVKPIAGHVPIKCLILCETQLAILVTVEATLKNEWFPLSQVSHINNIQAVLNGTPGEVYSDTLHVAKWLADRKGIQV